jgi:hypothetical protein
LQKDLQKWWLKNTTFITFTALILFTLSGTFNWAAAWVYLALILVIVIATAIAMDLALMSERVRLQEGTKRWDFALAVNLRGYLRPTFIAGSRRPGSKIRLVAKPRLEATDCSSYHIFTWRFTGNLVYGGEILSNMMTPVLLKSWFTFIPAVLVAGAYVARTALGDGVLRNELAGYSEYSQHVRYRLFPGLW